MGVFEAIAVARGTTTAELNTQEEAATMLEVLNSDVYQYETKIKRKETLRWATWVQKCCKANASSIRLGSWMV